MKRYIFSLFFIVCALVRVHAVGFTPTSGGLVVDLKQGDRILISVMVDHDNNPSTPDREYFVGNYSRYTGDDYFTYEAGHFLKLFTQPAAATAPADMIIWTVGAPLSRVNTMGVTGLVKDADYSLGGITYTIWNDGKTLKTTPTVKPYDDLYKFYGDLTDDYNDVKACDAVFVVPTSRSTVTSFDPKKTLGRADQDSKGRFNGRTGTGFMGMTYREVYMMESPRFNGPVTYTNVALVTFNTTNTEKSWHAGTIASGRAAFAYNDKNHPNTPRTVFRLYILDDPIVSCPDSYFFAYDEQNTLRYRQSNTMTDSTAKQKIYTMDHLFCMDPADDEHCVQTGMLNVPVPDSSYFYVGYKNDYRAAASGQTIGTNGAHSQFTEIRNLPLKNLTGFKAPAGAYGSMIADTTSSVDNLNVKFDPAGYFLQVTTPAGFTNVPLKQTGENEWTCEEMWTILPEWAAYTIKATTYTGPTFSATDPGADIDGWSVDVVGTEVPVHGSSEPVINKSGWARIYTDQTEQNGAIEFILAEENMYIRYHNNGHFGVDLPDQHAVKDNPVVTVQDARLIAGYNFIGWTTNPDGSGTTYLPNATVDLSSLTPVDGKRILDLYAKATYTGTINVAISFVKEDGKRYFLTHPQLQSPRYARARTFSDWTEVRQGMRNAENNDPNYISSWNILGKEGVCAKCGDGEYVLDPHHEVMRGSVDSLVFYEDYTPNTEEYLGLYYSTPNTVIANSTWAGLFTSSAGWPTPATPCIEHTYLASTHYLDRDEKGEIQRYERTNSDKPNILYNASADQFDGTNGTGTDFMISGVGVVDEHYIILPDTSHVWRDTIEFGYHKNEQTTEDVWSALIGKQLLAQMKVGNDTIYFHANRDKTIDDPNNLYLSPDFRVTQLFDFIPDSRVATTIEEGDSATHATTSHYWHHTITSGNSSPINIQDGEGRYIDVIDTFRINLSHGGISKIKEYRGRWKKGAVGLTVSEDGSSRTRDIIVRTKTYHYGDPSIHLVLTPEFDSYSFNPLAGATEEVNFTLTKVTTRQLLDVNNKFVSEEVVSIDTINDKLLLAASYCSFTSGSVSCDATYCTGTYFKINKAATVSQHVTLTTVDENQAEDNHDTLVVSLSVTIDEVAYPVSARVPLTQTSLQGDELIWSVVAGNQRYYIMAGTGGLIFRKYKQNGSTIYKDGTSTPLVKGSANAENDDPKYITPWRFRYNPSNANQLSLKAEYGINRYIKMLGDETGSKADIHASDSSLFTYHYVHVYTNDNANQEEQVKLQYGTKWLQFTLTGGSGAELVLVNNEADASVFSWSYLLQEYSLLNNGTYPSRDSVTFGYNTNMSVGIQTRYKAYKEYSMLVGNQVVYCCRENENDIADLIDDEKEWKTDTTFRYIRDARTFDGGSTPSPAVSGLSFTLNKSTLTTTVSTSGVTTSPTNVKIGGQYVNIVDTLHVTLSLKEGAPAYRFKDKWSSFKSIRDAELKIPLIRKTYHVAAYDSLVCTVAGDAYNHTFPNVIDPESPDSTYTFVLGTEQRTGHHVLDVDNTAVAVLDATTTDRTSLMNLSSKTLAEVQLVDEFGNTPSWCHISDKGTHSIEVTCTENGIRSPRTAYVYIAYIVTISEEIRFINIRLTVSQPSLYEYANNQHLVHSSGASGDPIGEDGMQQVHQNKRILYYYPDQNVELPVRESHFFGWWRWFREGTGEIGDSDIPDESWRTPPRNVGNYNYPFRIIGDSVDDGKGGKKLVTMGRYTVFHYKSSQYSDVRNNPPIKTALVAPPITTFGLAEKPTVTYAVDISNYYDKLPMSVTQKNQVDTARLDTMEAIPEPTLSLREVFELRPWTEMAERLQGYRSARTTNDAGEYPLADEDYMEDHVMMAPLKTQLLLSTEQRYNYENLSKKSHSESLLGYYMRDDNWDDWSANRVRQDTMIWCAGYDADCEWYTYDPKTKKYTKSTLPITESDDFLKVAAKNNIPAGQEFDTVYYCLRSRSWKSTFTSEEDNATVTTDSGDYMFNICRYQIIYHQPEKYGPLEETTSNGVTKALITNDEIEQRYEVLERLNFDYNKPGSSYTIYPHPLPWADASYGYTYPETPDLPHNRLHSQSDLPNFGEYGLVNRIHYTDYWYDMQQHGGAENGYMIYCDGMSSSGQVAALTLSTHLCAGQKMFFSGYVGNPSKQGNKAKPNFTFAVQASIDGTNWDDITTYTTGDLKISQKWYQIYFPIIFNESKEYEHFRVRIYNVSSDWDGNDFVIDDMCIFATKPPLIAYQANTACKEKDEEEKPTHVILRVDYQGITGDGYNDSTVYYTVKCVNKERVTSFVKMEDGYLAQETHPKSDESKPDTLCGRLYIPKKTYEPTHADSIFVNMNELIDTFDVSNGVFKEGYIYEILEGDIRPVKYVVHSAFMNPADTFTVHMSAAYKELLSSICGMTSYLKVSNQMMLELNGNEMPDTEQLGLCANATYDIGLRVKGSLYLDSVAPINLNGSCINDWLLYGDTADSKGTPLARYGYTYSDIVAVVKDILRCEPPSFKNTNQFAPNLAAVNRNMMKYVKDSQGVTLTTSDHPYDVLAHLVNKGFLTLYQPKVTATVYSGDSVQYVIFPILGTGTDTKQHSSVDVCPLPILIKLKPDPESAKAPLIVGGLNRDPSEMNQPVIVLADVTASARAIKLRVDSIMELVGIRTVELRSTDDPNFREGIHFLSYTPDKSYPVSPYYLKGDSITLRPSASNNYEMQPGYSYTYDIVMQTWAGKDTLPGGCPVGTVPFTLSVVPNYLRWDPQDETSYQWNKPGNWIGIDAHNQQIHANARFAPLPSTSIIIPEITDGKPYPELPDPSAIAPADSIQQVGFKYNICNAIRFMPGAAMSQQQRMGYTEAIIDMPMPHNEWAFRSAPVKGMISGDLFMANADLHEQTSPWEVGPFDATGRTHKTGNASYWLSLYSTTTVRKTKTESEERTADAAWSKVTNGMTLSLPPAQGFAVYARTTSHDPAAVRLPKNDDIYYYYDTNGNKVEELYEQNLQTLRNSAEYGNGHAGELAFHPDGRSESYGLTKGVASKSFVFGNPTMGYIDIWGFIADNTRLKEEIGYMASGSNYTTISKSAAEENPATDVITNRQRYLPPMHAMVITLKDAEADALTLSVKLDTCRVLTSPSKKVRAGMPRRMSGSRYPQAIMTVTATNAASPRCLSRLLVGQGYHDAVYEGEDAVLTTLSIDKYTNNTTPATPFNLYAAEGEYGLCIDLRDSIVNIPLSFYLSDLPFEPTTRLWFTGVNKMSDYLVLYDTISGTERPIADGIYIDIQTPEQSHEVRYYIRRRGYKQQTGSDVTTDFEPYVAKDDEQVVKFIKNNHVYILRRGQLYTILGQRVQ